MGFGLFPALAVCAVMSGGAQGSKEVRIPVVNTRAERIISSLAASVKTGNVSFASLPKFRADRDGAALLALGTPEEIQEIREIVRLLDVSPKRVRVKARIYRIRTVNGKPTDELLSDSVCVSTNNTPIAISVGDEAWDQTASFLPRINGDGSISMRVSFTFGVGSDVKKRPAPFERRIAVGNTIGSIYTDEPLARGDDGAGGEIQAGLGPQYRFEVQVLEIMPDLVRGR